MNALHLPNAEFRSLAARVTDLAADLLAGLEELPAFPAVRGEQVARAFEAPLPEEGLRAGALDALGEVLALSRAPTPRFYGYVLGSGEPVAALADLLASILNQNVTAWRSAPAAVTIERQIVRGLAGALGCEGFSGSLCGGGSMANLMGLAMARETRLPANEAGKRVSRAIASPIRFAIEPPPHRLPVKPSQPSAPARLSTRCRSIVTAAGAERQAVTF